MFKKICLLMLLHTCIFTSSVLAEGLTIVMAEQSKIGGKVITLGEIAQISGDDVQRIENLRQLKIGTSPVPGSSVVLTKEILDMRLAATGVDLSAIDWQIPPSISVTTNSQVISSQALIEKAMAVIRQQAGGIITQNDLSITPEGNVLDITAPVGNIVSTVELPYGVRYNSLTVVNVYSSVDGEAFNKVQLKFEVRLYRQAAVAARQLNANEILTTENLRYERMNIGRLGSGYVTDINKLLGLTMRRSLPLGMAVTDSMVKKPLIIKNGNVVNIVARIGNMEVTAMGQAMQDGSEGQLIRVQNVNSRKVISAKVIDENTVQVLTHKSVSP